ncbi:MarR family transcriptional regulator [Arthrobacter sp. MSA 4-2]|uniref:MarR family winged helix-turn-helix transcriptional regulator n=1 Tax=Arthrobacter sp. MSA 4-2 TaxID=2794349 RepID=UPI0018E6EB23|nr:MarR family transcriptional regulator [Arthrobacter sp. MSA 4-2]
MDATHSGINTLRALAASGPVTQTELAHTLRVQGQTVGHLLIRLEARSLVVRAPSSTDRRNHIVQITGRGQALLDKVNQGENAIRCAESRRTECGRDPGR